MAQHNDSNIQRKQDNIFTEESYVVKMVSFINKSDIQQNYTLPFSPRLKEDYRILKKQCNHSYSLRQAMDDAVGLVLQI